MSHALYGVMPKTDSSTVRPSWTILGLMKTAMRRSRARRELMELTDRQLADIGLTRIAPGWTAPLIVPMSYR